MSTKGFPGNLVLPHLAGIIHKEFIENYRFSWEMFSDREVLI
jgi:hypothetical protein